MKSWLEIENRFRSLAPSLKDARVDIQKGVAGEYYSLAAYNSGLKLKEFRSLICIAARLLEIIFTSKF